MQTKFGFTGMSISELEAWLPAQSVSRLVRTVQHHHTWAPSYRHFQNNDAFTLQRNMQHHHVGTNGWSDIGQHFSIFPDGMILTGRSLNTAPACIYGQNRDAICIESVGNFDVGHDQMTPAQEDAILRLTAALLKRFSTIRHDEFGIVYHHWFDLGTGRRTDGAGSTKSCPGTAYFGGNTVAAFRANVLPRVRALLGQPPATNHALPGVQGYAVVTASALNVRTGPGTQFDRVSDHGPVQMGAILRVYETRDDWIRIASSHDRWVAGRYTQPVTPGRINTDGSNCRSGPGMSFGVVAVFGAGDAVFVQEERGDWRRVGIDQWVHKSLIDAA